MDIATMAVFCESHGVYLDLYSLPISAFLSRFLTYLESGIPLSVDVHGIEIPVPCARSAPMSLPLIVGHWQWSFRKAGTMGMLASQVDIGVWVQALGRVRRSGDNTPECAKSCNIVHFCRFKHFNNGNCVSTCFPPKMTPGQWCRNEFESGGHRSRAKVGEAYRSREKHRKIVFGLCPSTFWL